VREGQEIIEQWKPRGIVLDLALPDAHGLRLLPELRHKHPETALVVCTALGSIAAAVAAMRSGANDFLLKPTTADQIGASLRHAIGGEQREEVLPEWTTLPDPMSLDRIQWEHLHRVLLECDWNISEAARRLRLHRQSLQRKLRHMPR
jgi:two-component system response regulator RegA